MIPIADRSNIQVGMRARLAVDVELKPLGTFKEGTEGHVVDVDHKTGNVFIAFGSEVLVLMPFECDTELVESLQLSPALACTKNEGDCWTKVAAALLAVALMTSDRVT